MASFEQHINGAVIASGVIIAPLHSAGLISIDGSFVMLFLGMVGGVLPDLDSDSSKPLQIAFKIISIFAPLLVLLHLGKEFPLLILIAIWILSSLLLHLILFRSFIALTRHRGIFHSIPMGILFAQLTIALFHFNLHYGVEFSTIAGFFLFYGFIIHLLLDEFVSLNALGLKVKHTLGSAFKLFDFKNWRGSLILYLLIAFFAYMVPVSLDIFEKMFDVYKGMKFYQF
jgi:hypothetical protein